MIETEQLNSATNEKRYAVSPLDRYSNIYSEHN